MSDTVYILALSVTTTAAILGWSFAYSYKKAYWRMHGMWRDMATRKKN